MLNELMEFAQYTAPIPDPDAAGAAVWAEKRDSYTDGGLDAVPQRLRYDELADNLSGIRRALTIVARGALKGKADRLPFAKNCLRLWCGYTSAQALPAPEEKEDAALYAKLDGWLPRYLRLLRAYKLNDVVQSLSLMEREPAVPAALCQKVRTALQSALFPPETERSDAGRLCRALLEDALPQPLPDAARSLLRAIKPVDTLNAMRQRLLWRERDYERPALRVEDESESDLFAVTFDAILADALEQGPLRSMALVAAACGSPDALYADVWMNKKPMDRKYEHFPEWEQQLLKLTAMVMQTRRADVSYPVPFNMTDADNEIGTDVKKKGVCQRFSFAKEKRPIFTLETLSSGVCMLSVSDEWMERGGWRLVEKSERDRYAGALYFTEEDGLKTICAEVGA